MVSKEKEKNITGRLERQMLMLAQARVNDAVKLAYLKEEDRNLIDSMDLTALREFKRAGTGAVEVKFADRMEILQRLLDLHREDPAQKLLRQMAGEDSE